MVCLLQRGGEIVEYRHGATSKVKDVMKHHFIHMSHHPSVRSSICPIMVCLLRRGEERVKYRRSAAGKCTVKYTHMCIRHEVQTCALGTGCIHLSYRPSVRSSTRPVMVCFFRQGGERVEPAPTNAPIGCFVHGMGYISSSSFNHSIFFSF